MEVQSLVVECPPLVPAQLKEEVPPVHIPSEEQLDDFGYVRIPLQYELLEALRDLERGDMEPDGIR